MWEEINGEKYISIVLEKNKESEKQKISVFNTGKNIPIEDMNRIWNRFYKMDTSKK